MLKYIKIFYDFLMKLKQFHFIHILIIPSASFFIISFIWFYKIIIDDILAGHGIDSAVGFVSMILFMLYFGILLCSFYAAVFIEIFILITQFKKKNKIYVKSKFLLHNKFYNVVYFLSLLNYLILILCYLQGSYCEYYCYIMYLLPFCCIHLLNPHFP